MSAFTNKPSFVVEGFWQPSASGIRKFPVGGCRQVIGEKS
jgi:hypothetical protein